MTTTKAQNFLARIVETKRERCAGARAARPLAEIRLAATNARRTAAPHVLRAALARAGHLNIIAEIKRASPSQGELRAELDAGEVARAYQTGGAEIGRASCRERV